MKTLTWKFVLPLTIISFSTITKWWYVEIDGYKEVLRGFPFPYIAPGWHTSLSWQIFIGALLTDLLIYFGVWLTIVYSVKLFYTRLKISAPMTWILIGLSGLVIMFHTIVLGIGYDDHRFHIKRPFEFKTIETGFGFHWQHIH